MDQQETPCANTKRTAGNTRKRVPLRLHTFQWLERRAHAATSSTHENWVCIKTGPSGFLGMFRFEVIQERRWAEANQETGWKKTIHKDN